MSNLSDDNNKSDLHENYENEISKMSFSAHCDDESEQNLNNEQNNKFSQKILNDDHLNDENIENNNEEFDFSDADFEDSTDDDNNNIENNIFNNSNNLSSIPTKLVQEISHNNNNSSDLINTSSNEICESINSPIVINTKKVPNLNLVQLDENNLIPDVNTKAENDVKGLDVNLEPFCSIRLTPKKFVDCNDNDHHFKSVVDDHQEYQSEDDRDDDDDDDDDAIIVQFLGKANEIAEARLAARRQARAEAREIRMRELERQQKELEQNADRVFDMQTAAGIDPLARSRLTIGVTGINSVRANSMSSRRSSEDSLEEEGRSLRDIRHELKDVEERFRKAMIANAHLDNARASQSYQIQLLKDKLEEMEESYAQLQREHKEKTRDFNALKRNLDKVEEELKLVQGQLTERDTLITEQGLVIVLVENEDGSDAKRALVTVENAQLLGSVQGSLDVRLKKFTEEKHQLQAEVQNLQDQLDTLKSQGRGRGGSMNGPLGADEDYEAQREANKIMSDYKYKLQKAEQEIASLQASLARSETQVIRYKSTAEAAEKAESELKIERRKLQRENREATERLEELETSNNHLLKRLDKLKNAKSALLKDL